MNHHSYSAFKNRCVTPPRDPNSRLPKTLNERVPGNDKASGARMHDSCVRKTDQSGEPYYCVEGVGLQTHRDAMVMRQNQHKNSEEVAVTQEDVANRTNIYFEPDDRQTVDSVFNPSNLSSLLKDDKKFYHHLKAMKMENKKTLKILDRLYNSYKTEDGTIAVDGSFIPSQTKEAWLGDTIYEDIVRNDSGGHSKESVVETADRLKDLEFTSPRDSSHVGYRGESDSDTDTSEEDSRHDYFQEWRDRKADPPPNILPDEDTIENFRGRHSSYDIIDGMWETFSVEEYAPDERSPEQDQSVKPQWKPKITIPKPFNMTLRESLNADQRAQKRDKIANELMQKSLAEEAELRKKFKAQPLPPSTYLPLYEELKIQEEERRENIRDLSKALLESKLKPFNFTKREEAMKAIRHQQLQNTKQRKSIKDDKIFKAQPFPEKLFDLSVEDKKAEQDEYRKIKMEMRSLELLASSSLPPNMKARGERYTTKRRQKLKKYLKEEEKNFKPSINHDIPDFDALQRRFDKEMMQKRKEKAPTVCQPFNLHTAKVPSRRSQNLKSVEDEPRRSTSLRRSMSRSTDSLQKSVSISLAQSESIPYSLTETSRLRQDSVRRSKELKSREEEAQKEKEKLKRRRERLLQQQVVKKSIPNDLKTLMKTQSEEKIKEFRRADAARQREYRNQIRELKSRLEERPLLFEREAQENARRRAEKRYQQILLDAGVDLDVVNDLVSSNREEEVSDAESDYDEETASQDAYDDDQTKYTTDISKDSKYDLSSTVESHESKQNNASAGGTNVYNDSEDIVDETGSVSYEDEDYD